MVKENENMYSCPPNYGS